MEKGAVEGDPADAPPGGEAPAPHLASVDATLVPDTDVQVLISHNGVLIPTRMGLDIMLEQAEAAIFRPEGSGNFEFLGKIAKTEW